MDFLYSLPLLQIHITAVFITLTLVVLADMHGLLWISGKMKTLPKQRMQLLHKLTWAGLIIIICAGFTMFTSYSEYLLSLPVFQLKMLFVFFLLLNAVVIGKHVHIAAASPFMTLSQKEKTVLLISGAISTFGWIGAFTCAQFL